MKNNKGFVISTTLYSIFGIMLITVFYILYMLSNNRMVLNTNIEDIKEGLYSIDGSTTKKLTIYIDKNSELEEYIKNKFKNKNISVKIRNYEYVDKSEEINVVQQTLNSRVNGSRGLYTEYVGTIYDTVIFATNNSNLAAGDIQEYNFCHVINDNCVKLSVVDDGSNSTIPWQGIRFDSVNKKIYLYSHNHIYSGASGTSINTYKYYEYSYSDTVLDENTTNLDISSKRVVTYKESNTSNSGYTCLGSSCISYGGSSSSVSSTKAEFDELQNKYNSGAKTITSPENPLKNEEVEFITTKSQEIYNNIAVSAGNWVKNFREIEIADEKKKWTKENGMIGFISNIYVKYSGDYSSKLWWYPSIVWYRPSYNYKTVGISDFSSETIESEIEEYVVFINNNTNIKDKYNICRFLEGLNNDIKNTYDSNYKIYLYGDECVKNKFSEIYGDDTVYEYSNIADEKASIDDLYEKIF